MPAPTPIRRFPAPELVQRLVQSADIPSLGAAVSRVARLAQSTTTSVGELANMILADVHLTQRVLRLANSAAVRRFSPPVTTVSKAIARIGSEQVKLIALSALLLERMADRKMVAYLAAELLQAVCASSIADQVAPRVGAEPEEAAVCALFRSIGRLMVGMYETECFDEVRRVAEAFALSESEAAREVTGTDLETIGQRILVHWGIPDTIAKTVVPYAMPSAKPQTALERLQFVSTFAAEVAVAMREPAGEERDARLDGALAGFGGVLGLDRTALGAMVDAAAGRSRQFTVALGLEERPATAPAAATKPALAELPEIALPAADAGVAPGAAARTPEGKPLRSTMLLLSGIQDMTTGIAEGHDIGSVLNIALETLYRGLGYQRAVLCLRDPATKMFRARLAFGDLSPECVRQFAFAAANGDDLFWSVMQRNVDVHIRDATEPRIAKSLPEWHRTACADARSFLLLPLALKQAPLGFFYADRGSADAAGLSEEELALVRMLKGQTLVALRGSALGG